MRPPPSAQTAQDPNTIRRSRLGRIASYRLLWLFALSVLVLDQLSKTMIAARLPFGTYSEPDAITVIHGFFYLVHVGNTGAAWSLLAGKSVFLALLATLTLGAIFFWRRHLGLRQPVLQVSFGLLCGGIAGNLVDRLLHGHVIDFIDLHFGAYVYPTFNIADIGICIGVGIYLIRSLREPSPEEAQKS